MHFSSTKSRAFRRATFGLLKDQGEIMVLIRYPNRCGYKEYFVLNDPDTFKTCLAGVKPEDSVTVFKRIEPLWRGLITEDSTEKMIKELSAYDNQWLLMIGEKIEKWPKQGNECVQIENMADLREEIVEFYNQQILIILEPEFWIEEKTLHAYGPNWLGIGKPTGAY